MTLDDLQTQLTSLGVLADAYSLNGELFDECLILERQSPNLWHVYYSERGLQTGSRWFETEDAACRHVLRQFVWSR